MTKVIPQRGVMLSASSDQSSKYVQKYHITEQSVLSTAAAALVASADCPLTFAEPLNSITLYRSSIDIVELAREDMWEATVEWVDKERFDSKRKLAVDEKRIRWNTSGGTAHISTSKATTSKYPAGDAFDNNQTIGLTPDGDVQGCDIVVPAFNFTVEYRFANGQVTNAYAATVKGLTGKVNNATFYGFAAGEVLCMGGDATQESQGDPTLNFSFLQMDSISSLDIGAITGIAKKGHEYLWVWYEEKVQEAADGKKWALKVPLYAFVESVYEEGDFSTLGIGTS